MDCPMGQSKGHMCSGVSSKSDFTSHAWVSLCPFCLSHSSVFALPFFLSLVVIQLALLERLQCPRHPAGPEECINNTRSCRCVLSGGGRPQRRGVVSSALRAVCAAAGVKVEEGRTDSGNTSPKWDMWACLWRTDHNFLSREGKGWAWIMRKDTRGGPWELCFSAPSSPSSRPLVGSHRQLLSKQENLKTRNSSWKPCCLLTGGCEILLWYKGTNSQHWLCTGITCVWSWFKFPGLSLPVFWFSKSEPGPLKLVRPAFTNLEVEVPAHHLCFSRSSLKTTRVLLQKAQYAPQ